MTNKRLDAIRRIWRGNALMQVLQLKIEDVQEGSAVLSMPVDLDVHTNHWLGIHGGALAALADSAGGIACASVGKIAQTLNMNVNYISNTKDLSAVTATSRVVHAGQSTAVVQTEIRDAAGNLMCGVSAVMFVSGELDAMKL